MTRPDRRRRGRTAAETRRETSRDPAPPGLPGGRYQPLSDSQVGDIIDGMYSLLETTGVSEAPDFVVERVLEAGGRTRNGRLLYPRELVESLVEQAPSGFVLCGRDGRHDLDLSGERVHLGTGGAAPMVVDMATGGYRSSTLRDLYDAACLVDGLQHVHFLSRPLVAGDMPDEQTLDINTAYACLAATRKHVATSAANGANATEIAELCFEIAGSQKVFAERPFLSFNVNHVTPPLRMSESAMEVLAVAAELGIPAHANVFGQVGASSPAGLGPALVQALAETLAGMTFSWLTNPNAKVICGPKPMIVDLRTGGMSGGGGEQGTVMAAATQVARSLGLPNVSIAGASDAKTSDVQSGAEKALTVTLAAHAGSNLVTQACGMQAALMAASFESYVLDNDMLGAIMSSLRPIDTQDLDLSMIRAVAEGPGHFLGESDTLRRMTTDFVYPKVADRTNHEVWQQAGRPRQVEAAKREVERILDEHPGCLIETGLDEKIRSRFDIRLNL
ncbi:MAG: trimethylamine methyltransferase family protein [Actinomycetota bacterium]|nr:trimethylamine methyltransferase family protein [Actinomycetota bacterium]